MSLSEGEATPEEPPPAGGVASLDDERVRDDRMDAYTPFLPAGTYETTYLVRATTPGAFLASPPRVEETEHPETFGRGTPDRIVVEAAPVVDAGGGG